MSRILALALVALVALTTPAAAQPPAPPAPTLTLDHLGPNDVPGPWLLAVTVQHTAWIRVYCAGSATPVRSVRNPFPSQPTPWVFVATTPLCPGAIELELDAIGPNDPPPVRFGPFEPTGGAYVPPAPADRSELYLPLLTRPLAAAAALDAAGAAVVTWEAPGAARACVTRLSAPPAALGCATASPWRQGEAAPLATRRVVVVAP